MPALVCANLSQRKWRFSFKEATGVSFSAQKVCPKLVSAELQPLIPNAVLFCRNDFFGAL
jgi:hypothetical protein